MESLDEIDRAILELLQTDGRLTGAEAGRRVGLSQPAAGARIQRLEKNGTASCGCCASAWRPCWSRRPSAASSPRL
ncbi:AsnC family transcriptional regulator [Streptomyces sp. NPDC002677]|uniref:Lrp/AsnC family transcriptional regulator n=1 Tax=Streptomyces sp. NPDC002677 TaxID=3154774 RepID=UPI0033267973